MKQHNQGMHAVRELDSNQRCIVCSKIFFGRNVRDQHMITHFRSISDSIMENMEDLHRHVGGKLFILFLLNFLEGLMSNQCPLCKYVMSTRKSLRHHLIFQHVLRDKGALNVLIGYKKAKSEECALVRYLLSTPELLWKRGPLRVCVYFLCKLSKISRSLLSLIFIITLKI